MPVSARPEFNFTMLGVGSAAIIAAARETQKFFGKENYDAFKRANKKGEYIPEEFCLRVDGEIYGSVEDYFKAMSYGGRRLWHEAMLLSNGSVARAYGILFPDQDKRATLTTNIAWSDNRPSTALKILTAPTRLIGEQCKYEQGRQLGFAFKGAEVIMEDGNGEAREVLTKLNDFFEEHLFIGRKGNTESYLTYSYHIPETNRLEGLSRHYPDPLFAENLWVKSLDFPVRHLAIRDESGKVAEIVPVLYDPREKDKEAILLKGVHRSLRAADQKENGGLIETAPYMQDRLGFRLVLMHGGRALRDRVTSYVEGQVNKLEGFEKIEVDDLVDSEQGDPNRMSLKRRQLYLKGLKRPIEMQVFTVDDWLRQEYEIGNFDVGKNMHDGVAHDLYDLDKVAEIAPYSWPFPVFGIDHARVQRITSYEIAARLGRKQRIHPAPYGELVA